MLDLWRNDLYQKELDNASLPEEVWEKLYGKKILITGATGMVCSFLVDLLRKKNRSLSDGRRMELVLPVRDIEYAKKRFPECNGCGRIVWVESDAAGFGEKLAGTFFHFAIAGAGNADPKQFAEHPAETMEGNLLGVTELLKLAKGKRDVRLVYLSTGEVYGNAGFREAAFREEDSYYVNSMEARACYPNGKRAAETFCAAYHKEYGVDVTVGRLCYIYGPTAKESDSRSVAQFLGKAAKGEDILLKSSGEQVRSYCYVADAAAALLYLMVFGIGGEAYNIADSGSNCSIAEFAGLAAAAAGTGIVRTAAGEREKAGFSKVVRAVQDPGKINAIGWKAEVSLEDGIKRTIEILRSENERTG